MECTTNRESVNDLEENLEANSEDALWKFIGPKIGEARNLLFSAILDILDKSKSKGPTLRNDSSKSIHWKNTKKSIWTLSSTDRQGSLNNLHLDSSVHPVFDDPSFATTKKASSKPSYKFENQSAENLNEVFLERKNDVCVRLNNRARKSSNIAKLYLQEKKNSRPSSMRLFSQDSIASKKSYYSVKRKKNLVIKCDYNSTSRSLSKHILQVYQHQSSQIVSREKSTNVSEKKLLFDVEEISNESDCLPMKSEENIAKTHSLKKSLSSILLERRNYEKSKKRKKSLQREWSFTRPNRRRAQGGNRKQNLNRKPPQSNSYIAKFSNILFKMFNAGFQFRSITQKKDAGEPNRSTDYTHSATYSSTETSTPSSDIFENLSKSRTTKRNDLSNNRSCDIPARTALSYENIPCAAPLFAPILNITESQHKEKEPNKHTKSVNSKPSNVSSFKLYSSKTKRFIDSFCGLKSRILASASRNKPSENPTPSLSLKESILFPFISKSSYSLHRSSEKLEDVHEFPEIEGNRDHHEGMTSRSDFPTERKSEIEHSERRSFTLRDPPIADEKLDSLNSDISFCKDSFSFLPNQGFSPPMPRYTEPFRIPDRNSSSDFFRYSMPSSKPSSPVGVFSTRQPSARPKPYEFDSPPSSEEDYRNQVYYNPYQYVGRPITSEENMYYGPEYIFPQYSSGEKHYMAPPMFGPTPSFIPARPLSCPFPGVPPNLPPHLTAHVQPYPYCYSDFYPPTNCTYIDSHPHFVDPFTSYSTRSSTSSGPSVHYRSDAQAKAYYSRLSVPPTRSLREHLKNSYGHNKLSSASDYNTYTNPYYEEEFARFNASKSLSLPSYPVRSFGSSCFLDIDHSMPKARRRKKSKYLGYPKVPVPIDIMNHPPYSYYPELPENPKELMYPFHQYHLQKQAQMDVRNRSFHRKHKSAKSSCHSFLLDQSVSTQKETRPRKLVKSSSSIYTVRFNCPTKNESLSATESCSDVNVSRSSATILLSKYKSADGKYKYQYTSSCTSIKTQTSESVIDLQKNKKREKRIFCDCPKPRPKSVSFDRKKCDTDTGRKSFCPCCERNAVPTLPNKNVRGPRTQVCSSATDVYWNFKMNYGKIKHFDDRIRFELQKIGIDQLIEASKPAKCCKKTILNEPSKDNLPYAASLASLPLDETDIKVIKQSVKMATKKKYFNCGDCLENRRKLMYYSNILADDYNFRKPKVKPKYEIRYMYLKLDDKKNVENLVNKKYNEKITNKFLKSVCVFLERSMYYPKLLLGKQTNLNDYFDRQYLFKSLFKKNQCFEKFSMSVPYDSSELLQKYFMTKRHISPGISENSNVSLWQDIHKRNNFSCKCSMFSPRSVNRSNGLPVKDERFLLSRKFHKVSGTNVMEVNKKPKKKSGRCPHTEDINSTDRKKFDLNPLMKTQVQPTAEKYDIVIVYSVQHSEPRPTLKPQENKVFSNPYIQLRAESCLTGLEEILRIIENFKIYAEKAIKDDDNLLSNHEQYLRLKMHVCIYNTFNKILNYDVNIDKLEDVCPFLSGKRQFANKKKYLCGVQEKSEKSGISCNKNQKLFKLNHKNDEMYSSLKKVENVSSKFRQDLVTSWRYFNWNNHYISTNTEKDINVSKELLNVGDKFRSGLALELCEFFTARRTENRKSNVRLIGIRNRELLLEQNCFIRSKPKNKICHGRMKEVIDLKKSSTQFTQHILQNQKLLLKKSVGSRIPHFSSVENQFKGVFSCNNFDFLINNSTNSKTPCLLLMFSRKSVYCADINVLTLKHIDQCNITGSTQLDNLKNSNNVVEKNDMLFFVCAVFFHLRSTVSNQINIVNKLRINQPKFSQYSVCVTEICNCSIKYSHHKALSYSGYHPGNMNKTLSSELCPCRSSIIKSQIEKKTGINNKCFDWTIQQFLCETLKKAKYLYNPYETKKTKRKLRKKNVPKECSKLNFSRYNSPRSEERGIDTCRASGPFIGKVEIEEEKTGNYGKQSSRRCQQKLSPEEAKVTTILPCCGASGGIVQRSGDSLESLLDDCLEHGKLMNQGDNDRNERRKTINYKMVEDTLLECLNLRGNSNSLQGMSHTILRYFTYTVFNEIKKNYYKHLSRKHRHTSYKNDQDFSVAYFNNKYSHAFPLGNVDLKLEEMETVAPSNTPRSKDDISSNHNDKNKNFSPESTSSVSNIESKISSKDAFLCNLPNAPPFILKMNKTSLSTEVMRGEKEKSKIEVNEKCTVRNVSSIIDSLELGRMSYNSSALFPSNKAYSEVSKHNLFIDNTCPTISNQEFRTFVGKSISFIENSRDWLENSSRGCFMSSPTICFTGLSGFSISPFTMDEKDSRKRGQNIDCQPSTDIFCNETAHHYQSKIPRMLHPGKYKVHSKMKNMQQNPGSKGYGKSQACSSRVCSHYAAENTNAQMNTNFNNMTSACPTKARTCAAASGRSAKVGNGNTNKQPQNPCTQPPVGDCVKGIRSDPGCYCPDIKDESITCPVRLKEDFPCEEEELVKQEEDNEDMCVCAPAEQPLLMKKSNIECDCANRNKCENETLIDPPVEKPKVFWALTKVSLLKDGTKNFEIIDVSPIPPGHYLMPEPNNLILVGPQPKVVKPPPTKNCTCK